MMFNYTEITNLVIIFTILNFHTSYLKEVIKTREKVDFKIISINFGLLEAIPAKGSKLPSSRARCRRRCCPRVPVPG